MGVTETLPVSEALLEMVGVTEAESEMVGVRDADNEMVGVMDAVSEIVGVMDTVSEIVGVTEEENEMVGVTEEEIEIVGVMEMVRVAERERSWSWPPSWSNWRTPRACTLTHSATVRARTAKVWVRIAKRVVRERAERASVWGAASQVSLQRGDVPVLYCCHPQGIRSTSTVFLTVSVFPGGY